MVSYLSLVSHKEKDARTILGLDTEEKCRNLHHGGTLQMLRSNLPPTLISVLQYITFFSMPTTYTRTWNIGEQFYFNFFADFMI